MTKARLEIGSDFDHFLDRFCYDFGPRMDPKIDPRPDQKWDEKWNVNLENGSGGVQVK